MGVNIFCQATWGCSGLGSMRGGGTVEVRSEGGQGEPDIQLAHEEEKHSKQVPFLCGSMMSDSRHLAAQLRSIADSMGTNWLQSQTSTFPGGIQPLTFPASSASCREPGLGPSSQAIYG